MGYHGVEPCGVEGVPSRSGCGSTRIVYTMYACWSYTMCLHYNNVVDCLVAGRDMFL